MSQPAPAYDCVTCGTCCCDGWDVLLDEADERRFERSASLMKLTTVVHTAGFSLRFMRKGADGRRCIALDGEIGGVKCRIYHDRPHLCRAFEVGSQECIESRRRRGLPV